MQRNILRSHVSHPRRSSRPFWKYLFGRSPIPHAHHGPTARAQTRPTAVKLKTYNETLFLCLGCHGSYHFGGSNIVKYTSNGSSTGIFRTLIDLSFTCILRGIIVRPFRARDISARVRACGEHSLFLEVSMYAWPIAHDHGRSQRLRPCSLECGHWARKLYRTTLNSTMTISYK